MTDICATGALSPPHRGPGDLAHGQSTGKCVIVNMSRIENKQRPGHKGGLMDPSNDQRKHIGVLRPRGYWISLRDSLLTLNMYPLSTRPETDPELKPPSAKDIIVTETAFKRKLHHICPIHLLVSHEFLECSGRAASFHYVGEGSQSRKGYSLLSSLWTAACLMNPFIHK